MKRVTYVTRPEEMARCLGQQPNLPTTTTLPTHQFISDSHSFHFTGNPHAHTCIGTGTGTGTHRHMHMHMTLFGTLTEASAFPSFRSRCYSAGCLHAPRSSTFAPVPDQYRVRESSEGDCTGVRVSFPGTSNVNQGSPSVSLTGNLLSNWLRVKSIGPYL